VLVLSEEDLVESSVFHMVSTRKGSRVMRRTFGAGLNRYVFDPIDAITLKVVERDLVRHLQDIERLEVLDVIVDYDPQVNPRKVLYKVEWRAAGTNKKGNLVFPFFFEG